MPLPSDYNDAVQSLNKKFKDPEIKSGSVAERDSLGIPIPYSGNFACVYKVRAGGRIFALRFFLTINPQTEKKYEAIKSFFKANHLPFFVDFDYQREAVLISGKWYPLVKMPWVDGRTLDKFVKENLHNPRALLTVANDFANVVIQMKNNGVAHGDLQHGNIIVTQSGIKLVDYDGLYCSATAMLRSNEIGMPNYQHPKRTANDISSDIDDFSAWIIFISLKIIIRDKSLFNDNDTLVFEKSDFENPRSSLIIKKISQHSDTEIRYLGGFIVNELLARNISSIPTFSLSTNPILIGGNKIPPSSWWIDQTNKRASASASWVSDWIKKKT